MGGSITMHSLSPFWRRVLAAWLSPSAVLCGIVGWASWELGMAASENRANLVHISNSAKTGVDDIFSESRDVTVAVLKPCKPGHPENCGLIPAVRQTVQDTGSAVKVMQQQVAQTQPLIVAAANNLNTAGDAVKDTAAHLNKTADAATGTLNQSTATLATFNTKAGPLLDAYTNTGIDIDKMLRENATELHGTLVGVQGIAQNMSGITGSVDKMTTHLEKQVDSPKPLWKTAIPMSETAAKIYACLVDRVCVN